ncbi:hypothetical protein J3R83DRAFT_14042 [Lanmaoa asiatica]|nr:hypothetical protein J3R83DRAFT_14042 [Lanmaoa asiatica]
MKLVAVLALVAAATVVSAESGIVPLEMSPGWTDNWFGGKRAMPPGVPGGNCQADLSFCCQLQGVVGKVIGLDTVMHNFGIPVSDGELVGLGCSPRSDHW